MSFCIIAYELCIHFAIQTSVVSRTNKVFCCLSTSMAHCDSSQVGPKRSRSRSPASREAAPPPMAPTPSYSFESERPTSPEPPPEAEAKAAAEEAEPCQRRQTQSLLEENMIIDWEFPEERELFGSDASGDTPPPMSSPLSLDSQQSTESFSDEIHFLRRPVPVAPPPPPPPRVLVFHASAPMLNITFNNCEAASVTVCLNDGES